jgi:pimeloyl-ACP methyl ester carboxylesterase
MYRPLIKLLSAHFFILAPDLPGFGLSDPLSHPSYETFTHFLSSFLDSQKIKKTNLCGVSLGGALSLKFTSTFPRRVSKLVLNSPPVFSLIKPKIFRLYRHFIRRYPQRSQSFVDFIIKNRLILYYYLYRPRYRTISSSLIKKIIFTPKTIILPPFLLSCTKFFAKISAP